MNKRLIVILSTCIAAVVIILATMFSLTKLPNLQNNGFTRNWLPASSEKSINQRVINPTITKISGKTDHSIFFTGDDPRWVIMTNLSLMPIDTFVYGVEANPKLRAPNTTIDSPHIYMYAKAISYFINGQVEQPQMDTLHLQTDLITRFAQLSPERLIIRGIDSTQSKQVFKLLNCNTGEVLKEINLFKKQQFGGFETDGFLQFDKSSQRIFYLQMFQNIFFCLDTNLNLLYTAHTIDTNRTNQVSVNFINNGKETKIMPTKARQSVNNEICTGNGYLFVISNLRADNEDIKRFNQYSPIDLYLIKDGTYHGSFQLPKLNGQKVQRIVVVKNLLVALYPDGLVATFKLPSDIIS